jgi:hypothetical protein
LPSRWRRRLAIEFERPFARHQSCSSVSPAVARSILSRYSAR